MTTVAEKVWQAHPRQKVFLEREEDEVLYGGAAGGGKTDALLIFNIRRRVQYPGSSGLFLRRTFADLSKQGAAIDRSQQLLSGTGPTYNAADHKWRFPNGSVLEFGYLQTEEDKYNYQGAQYEDICLDELTQFTDTQYHFLVSRARTVRDYRPLIRSATNPVGIGLGWVKSRFVDAAAPESVIHDPTGRTRAYVPAKLADNPSLGPEYEAALLSMPTDMRKALLEGSWDVFEGQVFGEFARERHTCRPFRLPDDWPRWFSVDFGTNAPGCVLWFTKSPDGIVYVYRELYAPMTAVQQAQGILAYQDSARCRGNVGDPSMWNRDPNGQTVALTYAKSGITDFQQANRDRLVGLQRIHEYLGLDELVLFEGCNNLIRTLPQLIYDKHKPEDVDTNGEDHAYDALRYGLMAVSQVGHSRILNQYQGTGKR